MGFANNSFPVSHRTYGLFFFFTADDPENPDYFNLPAFEISYLLFVSRSYDTDPSSNCAPNTSLTPVKDIKENK